VAAAVTEVEASILGEGLGVERREPLPRIYIELRWQLSGVKNLGGNVHVRLTVQQPTGHVGVGGIGEHCIYMAFTSKIGA